MIGETGNTAGESPPQPPKSKPTTILVPPRALLFASGSGPGFSPGPMTLVSNLFPEQSQFSFSQLLAGAIASPASAPAASPSPSPNPLLILNSPGYLSPLQSPFGMSHQQALAHVTAQAVLSQSFKQMQAELHHSSSKKPEPALEISQLDKKSGELNKVVGDGYNWRKYGQKQVKASEGPRSYYKCSQPNCSVKKKIERALDGSVLDVTYKGEHNHDFPKQNKRRKDSFVETDSGSKEALSIVHSESTPKTVLEHHAGNTDNCPKEDEDEDEPLAKRKSLDSGPPLPITASSHQAVSESKIVLQTRSEVDLLDDGYKWRKYGQKVVKGNPYPRSYYKCTYGGCNVRKHVERASVDPKAVITSYEGKHNHEIPTKRSSNARHMKTQKNKVSKNASTEEETDCGDNNNNDKINSNIPMNLQLEQGQVTA